MNDSIDVIVATHLDTWNSPNGPNRDRSIAAVYATDVVIGEPDAAYRGRSGMAEAISALHAQLPDMAIKRTGPIQTAHDLVTYTWELGPDGRPPRSTGRDVLIVGDQGITGVYVLIDAPDT